MCIAALLSLGVASCGEEQADVTESTEVAAPPEEAEEVAPTAAQVPVPEDFADEARTEIDEGNYRDELANIETELAE